MKRGILIFAHNSRDVDYASLALISAGLAKKHLNVPATLVTDRSTVEWMEESGIYPKAKEIFENIILTEISHTNNSRRLSDGVESKIVPFINSSRASAWDLTPYDRTLLLDSDFLIFSDQLSSYWDIDSDFLISRAMNDVRGYDVKNLDSRVSDTGPHLFWATNIIFSKTQESKNFFDYVKMVRDQYNHYSDVYRFETYHYRNDIAFSVVKHMLDGFVTDLDTTLPPILTAIDRDVMVDIDESGVLLLTVDYSNSESYVPCRIKDLDIHIMNKQSIIRNKEKLMKLI